MQNTALAPFNPTRALTITTTDGQSLSVAPANSGAGISAGSVVDMLGGAGGKPLPRLIVAQPKDSRGLDPAWQGQFILSQSDRGVNAKGENEQIKAYSAPLGRAIQGRIVGYTLNRSLMPKFDPRNQNADANKPLCHSENFITPDVQFDGKYAHQCVSFDPKRGSMVATCPMASWGVRDPQNGKSAPPACNETYVLVIALVVEGQWHYAEVYFKSSAAKSGKTLIQQLRALELKGYPLYTYPVELTVSDAGVGYSFTGRLFAPPSNQAELGTPDESEVQPLEDGVQRWAEALKFREERAARTFDDTPAEQTLADQLADSFAPASSVVSVAPPVQQAQPLARPTELPKKAPIV